MRPGRVPLAEIKTDDIDAAAVMVQEGTRDKPGIILGAAYHAACRQQTTDGRQSANSERRPTRCGRFAVLRPPHSVKKKAGVLAGLKDWGIEPYAETLARSVRTPGGWGAEESGTRSGPGLEATVCYFAGQLGGCLAEMGPHYDSLNEAVIPAGLNRRSAVAVLGIGAPPSRSAQRRL